MYSYVWTERGDRLRLEKGEGARRRWGGGHSFLLVGWRSRQAERGKERGDGDGEGALQASGTR